MRQQQFILEKGRGKKGREEEFERRNNLRITMVGKLETIDWASSFPGDYPRGWNEEKVDTGVARIKSAAFPSAHRSRARLIAARVGDYARGSVV